VSAGDAFGACVDMEAVGLEQACEGDVLVAGEFYREA